MNVSAAMATVRAKCPGRATKGDQKESLSPSPASYAISGRTVMNEDPLQQAPGYSAKENNVGSDAVQEVWSRGSQPACIPGQPEQRWMVDEVTPS
jgi:hypothetical protein